MTSDGWADYPDSGIAMGALIGQLAGLSYSPNLNDVGHGSAYSPGSIADDARALNFLGFLPDALLSEIPDSFGQGGLRDQAAGVGAFHPIFRQSVTDFQQIHGGLTVDGFIGPNTRRAIKQDVDAKNQREPAAPASPPPGGGGGLTPVISSAGSSSTLLVAGIAAAVAAAGYAAWKFL